MNVTFYSGFSKKPNSTKRPSGSGTAKTVTLKNPTSVINPVFILTGYDLSYNYVVWGSRYYYVDDIIIVHNDVAEYHCSTDVLATYKTSIGSSTQYVTRAASALPSAINDSIYPTKADCTVNTLLVDKLSCIEDSGVTLNSGYCYIIGVQNKRGSSHGGIAYYAMSGSAMNNLMDFMFGTPSYLDAQEISIELQKELVNPFQYISSIMWFPFDLTSGPSSTVSTESLSFGFWEHPDGTLYGYHLGNRALSFSGNAQLPNHPQVARGSYLNGSPYTRHQLIFNSFGSIPIDASYYVDSTNRTIAFLCDVDLITGTGILRVLNANGDIVFKTSAQVGVNAQISQVTQNMTGAGVSILSGAIGLAYGNVVGFGQGILSGLENVMPERQTAGALGSTAAWEGQAKPEIISTFYHQTAADVTQLGRPLCAPTVINTLSGYVRVENADIDITGTSTEKNEIISYMEGGFFYE